MGWEDFGDVNDSKLDGPEEYRPSKAPLYRKKLPDGNIRLFLTVPGCGALTLTCEVEQNPNRNQAGSLRPLRAGVLALDQIGLPPSQKPE